MSFARRNAPKKRDRSAGFDEARWKQYGRMKQRKRVLRKRSQVLCGRTVDEVEFEEVVKEVVVVVVWSRVNLGSRASEYPDIISATKGRASRS
jgi:hypothetical protein